MVLYISWTFWCSLTCFKWHGTVLWCGSEGSSTSIESHLVSRSFQERSKHWSNPWIGMSALFFAQFSASHMLKVWLIVVSGKYCQQCSKVSIQILLQRGNQMIPFVQWLIQFVPSSLSVSCSILDSILCLFNQTCCCLPSWHKWTGLQPIESMYI